MSASNTSRSEAPNELAITFPYYRDLQAAMRFYENTLGLRLAIDQGWRKIYRICPGAHVGLVDEIRGMTKWAAIKPVQLCFRVPIGNDWFTHAKARELDRLSEPLINDEIGIRAFVFNDPEGCQIEIQTATRDAV